MPKNLLYIPVLTWKDDSSLYFPSGVTRQISCNHVNEGNFGVSIKGEPFPIATTTIPPLPTGGNQFQSETALEQGGAVFGKVTPFSTTDPAFKLCVRIKEMGSLTTLYVDAADYAAKISGCNLVDYASACGVVTNLNAGTPATTSATITWTDFPGGAAIEWINNTSSTPPVVDGSLLAYGVGTETVTGLTAATVYHFWIRTVCTGGVKGAWISLTYTTHA